MQNEKLSNQVISAITSVLKTFSASRAMMESMMAIDFKMDELRDALMRMSFASLASWPVVLMLIYFCFDPTRSIWSLQGFLSKIDSQVGLWLYEVSIGSLTIVFLFFFLIEWFLRKEYWLVFIILFLQSRSDIHLTFSLVAFLAIYFSQSCYLWWFHIELKSVTLKRWLGLTNGLYISWLISTCLTLAGYFYLQKKGYFSFSITANRYEFLFLSIFLFYFLRFFVSSIWGHFYYQKWISTKLEPTDLQIHYSTTTWLLRFKMQRKFKALLKEKINTVLPDYDQKLSDYLKLKDQGPVSIPDTVIKAFQQEWEYLKLASQRLAVKE